MRKLLIFLLLAQLAATTLAQGFIENQGQWEESFHFKGELPNGAVFLEPGALVFHLRDPSSMKRIHDRMMEQGETITYHSFKLRFEGANLDAMILGQDTASHYYNFYLGNDPARWKSEIYAHYTVMYEGLYEGIDLLVRKTSNRMKYEFRVAPGADPSQIQIKAEGLDGLNIDRNGNLIMNTAFMDVIESKPFVYQDLKKERREVEGRFVLNGDVISYELGSYNDRKTLIIDPEIIFSTFTGSSSDNWGFTAAPDNNGYLYSGGIIHGTGYPTTSGAYDRNFNLGEYDVSITKFDTSGTALIFSTYLGGSEIEHPHSMIVNSQGELYVMGSTGSDNFPAPSTAYDDSFNGGTSTTIVYAFPDGSDIFVTGFNASGSNLIGSTFLGGSDNDGLNEAPNLAYNYSDEFRGEINLDPEENILIVSSTESSDFPIVGSPFDSGFNGGQDAVVAKLSPNLSQLIWSSFLGGASDDAGYGIDIARDSTLYVAGGTSSGNFPASSGAFDESFGGFADGYLAHISADGTDLLEATYYGTTSYDQIHFVQLDRRDHPHFFGQTEHNGNNLIFNANFSDVGGGQIVGVLEPDLSAREWTTQFGSTPGQPNISPTAFLVDVCNSVYISGWGGGPNSLGNNNASNVDGLPVTNDAFQSNPDSDGSDFYLAVISSDGNSLEFGSFYGGPLSDDHVDGGTSRFDRGGQIYQSVCAGCGGLSDFPIVPDPGAWSTSNSSNNCNNAVFKIDFELPIVVADFNIPDFACAPYTLNVQNNSVTQSNTTFSWDFGNGQTSSLGNPSAQYNTKGVYQVRLVVSDPNSCNLSDTLIRTITIAQDSNYVLPEIIQCIGRSAELGPNPADYDDLSRTSISWLPTTGLDDPTSLNPTASVTNSTLYRLVIDYGGCQERILQQVTIDRYPISTSDDTIICSDFVPFRLEGTAFGAAETFEWSDAPDFSNIIGTDSIYDVTSLNEALNYFYFRTTKPNGCQMIDTILVTISDQDIELTPDTGICRSEPVIIQAISENPLNTFDYYWTLNDYSTNPDDLLTGTDQNSLEILLTEPETYYLIAISNRVPDCRAQDSVKVLVSTLDLSNVNAFAEQDTFYRGELIQLNGEPVDDRFNHTWSPTTYMDDPSSYTPQVRPKEQTDYIWTVSDTLVEECSASDTIRLSPYEIICDTPEIYIPSAFSPDGDGVNDVLLVRGRNIESMTLIIHDRWGNEVFRSKDQSIGWDGNHNGAPTQPGVYVYQLEAVCPTSDVYSTKGNVTKLQ